MSRNIKTGILFLALLFPLSVFAAKPAILVVFDGSGSMWGKIEGKTKIELAKKAMGDMLKAFPEDIDIGLIAYGHRNKGDCNDIELLAPLASDRSKLIRSISSITPKGKTPLTKSIEFSLEQITNRDGATFIVVVSDGKESCGGDPCEAARKARLAGAYIQLDVVGFDVKKNEALQLQCIAKNGGGKYYSADNANELAKSFKEIKESIAGNTPLIHHYEFNTDASDSAGHEDGELLNGATVSDSSLMLDGKDDYVQFDRHIIPVSGSYTLTFFARQLAAQKSYVEFISQGRSRGPGFYIGQAPTGAIRVTDFSAHGTAAKMPTDGKWHHYALAVDATGSGKTQLFIDNVPQVAFNKSLFSIDSGTHTRFGRQFDPYKEFFFGRLDDIRIYKGVLTIGEINTLSKKMMPAHE